MLSLNPVIFNMPEFKALDPAVQKVFRAQWGWMQALLDEGVDLLATGEDPQHPGYDAPPVVAAADRLALAQEELTEDQRHLLSEFAHRMDYPEMYEDQTSSKS